MSYDYIAGAIAGSLATLLAQWVNRKLDGWLSRSGEGERP